ncbi:MAG: C1 family peptidase [Bacillales bacterium]
MKNIKINEQILGANEYHEYRKDYSTENKNVILRHALSTTNINDVVFDQKNLSEVQDNFSVNVKTLPVCNQYASGRCWIFAGLNVLREVIAKKCNLENFELSQNYVALYDKLEKANYLIVSIMDLICEKPDSRVLMHLLANGVSDGGQWDMFRNLVVKYGIVPKSVYPETFQSNNTRISDSLLNSYIREFAYKAQKLHKDGKSKEISILKSEVMSKIYALFINSFGVPPTEFNFEYTDKDGEYHIDTNLTPLSFFEKYIGEEIDEYVSIINSPTSDKPYMKSFTIDYLGNVIEGKLVTHLNLPMERMKELIISQLKEDNIVWFGSDVSFFGDRKTGIWDDLSYDYMSAFDFDLKFDKAAMLDYRQSAMNHAMCLTGVNLRDDVATKWKVENSWGDKIGNKGYFIMSSSWFDTFVYQAVVKKKYLTKEELDAYNSKPIVLDPWDPMGTLA